MVEQYPDTITISVRGTATQDSNGNWTAGTASSTTYKCRAEIGSGGKIVGADGASYEYSFLVYMPKTTNIIPQDSEYVLTKGSLIVRGKVKYASNGQLNSRIWL